MMDVETRLERIAAMERAVMAGDASGVARYLTEDILYSVGARPTVQGIDAVIAYVASQSRVARWEGHTLRSTWQGTDSLVVEVVSHFVHVESDRPIDLPCTDIYRYRDGRIHDWRVYADLTALGMD